MNAGAIATVSLVPGDSAEACWGKILDMQSRFAGRPIGLSDEVNRSEQTTNFHNRAIGWLLYSAGTCYCDPMRRSMSIRGNARRLSRQPTSRSWAPRSPRAA